MEIALAPFGAFPPAGRQRIGSFRSSAPRARGVSSGRFAGWSRLVSFFVGFIFKKNLQDSLNIPFS